MIQYNVSQIRTRLGSIMKKIYTNDFVAIYDSINALTRENFIKKVPDIINDTDAFIVLLSNCLDEPLTLRHLIQEIDPLILFSVVIRYHLMTNFFISINQNRVFLMRESDKDFLLDSLIRIFRDDYTLWVQSQ